jgi:hypothetical protein
MSTSGLSALINLGAWLENDLGVEVLSISGGYPGDADETRGMEIAGAHLAFTVLARGNVIRLAAQPMGSPCLPVD